MGQGQRQGGHGEGAYMDTAGPPEGCEGVGECRIKRLCKFADKAFFSYNVSELQGVSPTDMCPVPM